MLTMFTALEARATAFLKTAQDYSLYQHIEIRILDSVQHGGTYIIYTGPINDHIISALEALEYVVVQLEYGDETVYKISWDVLNKSGRGTDAK